MKHRFVYLQFISNGFWLCSTKPDPLTLLTCVYLPARVLQPLVTHALLRQLVS